jgi:hypothetical protein
MSEARVSEAWSLMMMPAMVRARFLYCIDGRIQADRTGSNRMEYFSGTHLVKLLGHMIRVQTHCRVITGHFVERNDRVVITGNVPTMSDAPQHVEELAVGAHCHEG